jgi:pheromone alpha factor receptor
VSISNSFPEAGTIALTLVALLLPLSSLWASMSIHEESSSFDINHLSGYNMQMSNTPHSYGSNAHSKTTTSSARRTDYTAEDEKADFEEFSPTTINNKIESGIPRSGRDSTEMDLEAMGVRIDKSFSLHSTNGEGVSRK